MPRRLHTPALVLGDNVLPPTEAHHARDVLRLDVGDRVELFDPTGAVAEGTITSCSTSQVVVRVEQVGTKRSATHLTVAAAIPKGDRADWMVEKLSEIGVDRWIPLLTARSVVKAEGKNKLERWTRIATESAKQSRRPGVMRIETPRALDEVVTSITPGGAVCLSTAHDARPIASLATHLPDDAMLLIGPEGGWTHEELARLSERGVVMGQLTETILRVETAAIAAAAIVSAVRLAERSSDTGSSQLR